MDALPEEVPLIPTSRRRLDRDIAEMVKQPYPNTRLIPSQDSLRHACLLLNTGTRVLHVDLMFMPKYPQDRLLWYIDDWYYDIEDRCPNFLMDMPRGTQAYTIKTFAIHLLSMFNGDYELRNGLGGAKDEWVLSEWDPSLNPPECDSCGWYRGMRWDIVHQDADDHSAPSATGASGQYQATTLQDLPDELLLCILKLLEVEDIIRFGQAYKKVKSIIEEDVFIRNIELRCFVTKEHFEQSPLGIGIFLPPLDQQPGRAMESEFDLVSADAYSTLGVFNTAHGCMVLPWLPLPLSEGHWYRVKDRAYMSLKRLARLGRRRGLADCMDVLTAFMEDQVTKLFASEICWRPEATGMLRPSEKGIESLFFIFHLLLCVAVDNPEYVAKANRMIVDFQSDGARVKDMPSPGRLLATLLISDVETDVNFRRKLFFETVTRNVPRLLTDHPELEYLEHAASPYRLRHTFRTGLRNYRALMFLDLLQRKVRSADLGKPPKDKSPVAFTDILKAKRDFLFHRRGFPPSAVLADLVAELPRIRAVDSFSRCLDYLGVDRNVDERSLAGELRDTVRECLARGDRTPWSLQS